MKKEDLKPFTFYHWKETTDRGYMEDICFIADIWKTSSPGNYQCNGIEIEQIHSDLVVGNSYNYHFLYGERAEGVKYKIKEISIDKINKAQFFDWVFDPESRLTNTLWVHYGLRKNKKI